MIIGIINSKGGVGKTTSSIYLGKCFADMGLPVLVIDLDPQGSASEWADIAEEKGDALPFPVESTNLKRLGRLIRDTEEGTVIILDTPPGDASLIDAAIRESEFAVIPTQASAIEVSRTWQTLPYVGHIPHGVLITSARLGTKSLDEAVAALEDHGVGVFSSKILIRESIRASYGATPTRHEGYKSVAAEIMEAFQ